MLAAASSFTNFNLGFSGLDSMEVLSLENLRANENTTLLVFGADLLEAVLPISGGLLCERANNRGFSLSIE